jgi:hypothetical protein
VVDERKNVVSVEIPAGAAPAIILTYSFGNSLYHRVVSHARNFRLSGDCPVNEWHSAVSRVADLYLPLGPFNWFEYAILRSENLQDMQFRLNERAVLFAREMGSALGSVADDYILRFWEDDRRALDDALSGLYDQLCSTKDSLLSGLAQQLNLHYDGTPLEVTLVPHSHEPVGAYSHPTVIGVDRFQGHSLIEALLHEIGHVATASGRRKTHGGFSEVRAVCKRLGRNERFAAEVFHLLLFHAAGATVRTVFDESYVTLATRQKIYESLGKKLGTRLSEEDVELILRRRERGEISLEDATEEINELLKQKRPT